ncbi:hypothetical protein C0995_004431, partial [Termitomyces sp. Mi166
MLRCGNKRQVANGVQVPPPKQPLTEYHPVDTPKSPPSASTEASSSQRKEPKVAKEKLLPKDKGKKLMKPTVEEVPKESLPPIHQAFNTIWDHNITMTVGGALAISQLLQNHFQEMVTLKRITNANM